MGAPSHLPLYVMTQESIEIVRAAISAWNRADFDAWIGAWDERAEFHPLRAQSEGRAYRSHAGLRRFVAEIAAEWEQVRFEVDEIRGAGEQVVALGRLRARERASGAERDVPLALVGVVRDKKLVYSRCAAMKSEGEQGVSDLALLGPA
jgi:ketosteroid isomerase-like protein